MGAAKSAGQGVRRPVSALLGVSVVLLCVLFAAFGGSAHAQAARVAPGDILVAEPDTGRVVALDADNKVRVVQGGLNKPVGVTALADGTVLVAEAGTNRILGYGGRYADGSEVARDLPNPQALTTGGDGTPYVTLGNGELGKLDLNQPPGQRYMKITDGLRGPGGLVERGGFLYVAEGAANVVTQISLAGEKTQVGPVLQQPVGVAAGPGRTLFVAELKAGRISKIDDAGVRTDFAIAVDSPQQIAVDPRDPGPDTPYTVTVATKGSVQRFDRDRKRVYTSPDVAVGRGVSAVPASQANAGSNLVSPTTRPRTTGAGTRPDVDYVAGPSYALVASLVIIGGLAVFAVVMFFFHEPKGSAQAGFEERPLDETVFEVFGPCANQEVELAEAEGGLRAIVTQLQSTEKAAREAERRISAARDRAGRAQQARQKAARARVARARAGQREPVPGLRTEELQLHSSGGHAALSAFRSGQIDANELEERWQDLGEAEALEYVQIIGVVVHAKGGLSVEEVRAARMEERSHEELERAERERRDTVQEVERLRERQEQAVRRIREVRRELDACSQRNRARSRGGRRSPERQAAGRSGRRDGVGSPPERVPEPARARAAPRPTEPVPVATARAAPARPTAKLYAVPDPEHDATTRTRFRPPEPAPAARRSSNPVADWLAASGVLGQPDEPRNGGWPPAAPPPPARPPAPRLPAPPPPPPAPPSPRSRRPDGPDSVSGFLWDGGPRPKPGRNGHDAGGDRARPAAAPPRDTGDPWYPPTRNGGNGWPPQPRADQWGTPNGFNGSDGFNGSNSFNGSGGSNGSNGSNGSAWPPAASGPRDSRPARPPAHIPPPIPDWAVAPPPVWSDAWSDNWQPADHGRDDSRDRDRSGHDGSWPAPPPDWPGREPNGPNGRGPGSRPTASYLDPAWPDQVNGNGRGGAKGRRRREEPPDRPHWSW
jgi:hypothetical protein